MTIEVQLLARVGDKDEESISYDRLFHSWRVGQWQRDPTL